MKVCRLFLRAMIFIWLFSVSPPSKNSLHLESSVVEGLYEPPELLNRPPIVCKIGSPDCFPEYIEGNPYGEVHISGISWECIQKIPSLVKKVGENSTKDWLLIRGPMKAGKYINEQLFFLGIYAYDYHLKKYKRVGLIQEGATGILQCPRAEDITRDGYLETISNLYLLQRSYKKYLIIRSFAQGKEYLLSEGGAGDLADIDRDGIKELIGHSDAYIDSYAETLSRKELIKGPECRIPELPPLDCFIIPTTPRSAYLSRLHILFYSTKEKKYTSEREIAIPFELLQKVSEKFNERN